MFYVDYKHNSGTYIVVVFKSNQEQLIFTANIHILTGVLYTKVQEKPRSYVRPIYQYESIFSKRRRRVNIPFLFANCTLVIRIYGGAD